MGSSNSKSETETINWNNIKTENISSTMPNFNGLSKEAKDLIASLNIPAITESETSEFTVNHILDKINNGLNKEDQSKFTQLLEKVSSQTASEGDELSNTSPFISSEMYEYLINSKTSEQEKKNQQGGAKKAKKAKKANKTKSKKGGALDDDDSDTSSTSSDSDLEDILDSTEEEVKAEKAKKDKKDHDKSKKPMKSESESESDAHSTEMSGGELSYLSSSAHTDREFSDSDQSKDSEESKQSTESVESSSQTETSSPANSTVTDENKNMLQTSESINTDDINMISDY